MFEGTCAHGICRGRSTNYGKKFPTDPLLRGAESMVMKCHGNVRGDVRVNFVTLPALHKNFVNIFFVFAWEFCIEKWGGFLVNFFWSPSPTNRSTKSPRKIRGKFGANSGQNSGRKFEKFGKLSFCDFSDLKLCGPFGLETPRFHVWCPHIVPIVRANVRLNIAVPSLFWFLNSCNKNNTVNISQIKTLICNHV